MIDIFSLSANKLAEKLKEGEVSSVEVCSQYIERIKKFEKDVKAWAHFDKKELLEKAEEFAKCWINREILVYNFESEDLEQTFNLLEKLSEDFSPKPLVWTTFQEETKFVLDSLKSYKLAKAKKAGSLFKRKATLSHKTGKQKTTGRLH